jgi:hypothetical protein
MTISTLIKKAKENKIGKVPVVVLPLRIWRELESRLEDAEMVDSTTLKKKIAKARAEKKLYSFPQIKKALRI